MTFRPLRAYRTINRDLSRLRAADAAAEEEARLELTRRATIFSHRSREVVNSTMQLSAVLLRAGEVEEANKLLAEVDQRVGDERAVLIETVNEVKIEGARRRRKMTKLRLAKILLSAVLGASMMVFSVFGVAVAGYLAPDPEPADRGIDVPAGYPTHDFSFERHALKLREIEVAPGIVVTMTGSQLATFERLRGTDFGGSELEAFLRGLLPGHLAERVAALAGSLNSAVDKTAGELAVLAERVKKDAADAPEGTNTSAEDSGGAERKQKSSGDDNNQSGDGGSSGGGRNDECEGDESGEGSGVLSPGDCIPLVNKESPI